MSDRRRMLLPDWKNHPNVDTVHLEDGWCSKVGCIPLCDQLAQPAAQEVEPSAPVGGYSRDRVKELEQEIAMESGNRFEGLRAASGQAGAGPRFSEWLLKAHTREYFRLAETLGRENMEHLDNRVQEFFPVSAPASQPSAELENLRSELKTAKEDAASWKRHWQMYRDAWVRELGGWTIPKAHEIDSLVLTTRKRCVNPLLGNCATPHWLGEPTEDRKALQQIPHPRENSCKDWKVDSSEALSAPKAPAPLELEPAIEVATEKIWELLYGSEKYDQWSIAQIIRSELARHLGSGEAV